MNFFRRRQTQLQEEIQAHIAFETEENIQAGMSPEEARHAAIKKFGNPRLTVERSREVWGLVWFERLLQDLRYALRALRKSPGYTATAVLTLALGLGATATILAVVDSVLLCPVAIPHPEQLVMVQGRGGPALADLQIQDLRQKGSLFSAVSAYDTGLKPVVTPSSTRVSLFARVTPDLFSTLNVHALRGHLFRHADATAPVVVLSYAFWHDWLHAKPGIVGSTLKIGGKPQTVIGILPKGVHFPFGLSAPFVYLPLSLQAKSQSALNGDSAYVIARMKPGVTLPQARAEAASIIAHDYKGDGVTAKTLFMQSYQNYLTGDLQKPLYALLGGVLVLLLIACANVANLQIVRSLERMEEMHVRSALGASFARLLQQLITESVVVAFSGALLGGAISFAAIAAIKAAYGDEYARFQQLALHPLVFFSMASLALAVGILASLAPAMHVRRQTMASTVKQRTTPRTRLSSSLVALQVALTCVLLVVCGLFVRTFVALQHVQLGFQPHHLTELVLLPQNTHKSPTFYRETDEDLLRRFQALPGVQSAALQSSIPFSQYQFSMNSTTDVSTRPYRKGDSAFYSIVSSNFVQASGIHLLHGRGFLPRDDGSKAIVVLVNQAFAHKFLAGHNPLGVTVKFHSDPGDKPSDNPLPGNMTVVGVVQNELQGGDLGAAFEPMVYLDYAQLPAKSGFLSVFNICSQFAIRSTLPQGVLDKELRATLKRAAPDMAELQLEPMEKGLQSSLAQRRLALRLVSSFGILALLLSAIGIYGVLAYAVTLRRKEIGIRMALGSSRGGVIHLVMKKAAWMVLFGVLPGMAGAWFAARAVKSFLFGVTTLDPLTEISVAIVLLLVAALAASVPAWRAARVDPMEVLRAE
jgi:putative ABC transport system permease protein